MYRFWRKLPPTTALVLPAISLGLLAVFLAAFTLSTNTQEEKGSETWKYYVNKELGLSFHYPPGWKKKI